MHDRRRMFMFGRGVSLVIYWSAAIANTTMLAHQPHASLASQCSLRNVRFSPDSDRFSDIPKVSMRANSRH
jgi:hypothetical protein